MEKQQTITKGHLTRDWRGTSKTTSLQTNDREIVNAIKNAPPYGDQRKSSTTTAGPQCYKCKGHGHFAAVCPTKERKVMLASEMISETIPESSTGDQEIGETEIAEFEEERLQASKLPLCVVHRMLSSQATPAAHLENEWRRTNIFHTRVACKGKALNVILDNGNGLNVISIEAVEKLHLPTEEHPTPYNVSWIHDKHPVKVQHRCLLSFSLGDHFQEEVWCDILPMTVCHVLLGRPWMYDRKVSYDGFHNTYSLIFKNKKLVLEPLPIMEFPQKPAMILSPQKFQRALLDSQVVFMLVSRIIDAGRETGKECLPTTLQHLLQQFKDVFSRRASLTITSFT